MFDMKANKKYFWILLTLLLLFLGRVIGQLIVFYFPTNTFLPVMDEWYSGLIPYYLLLPSQIIILIALGIICYKFSAFSKHPITPSYRWAKFLFYFGTVYLIIMMTRYVIRMSLYPTEHWIGGSIPIIFHMVLASFVLTLAAYHWQYSVKPATKHTMKKQLCKCLCIFIVLSLYLLWIGYQLSGFLFSYYMDVKPGDYAVRISRNSDQVMSDGIKLRSDIYRPYRLAKTPTILIRLPYAKTTLNKLFATIIGKCWAEHGYTVVIQGTRGRYDSEGQYYPLRNERADGLATLQWLAKQSWYNGQIAMWGGSYFGYTQWVLADAQDPKISAMIIQISSTSFYSMFYPGGAFSYESALYWALNSYTKQDITPSITQLNRGFNGSPVLDADMRATGEEIQFFRDWATHTTNDDYWQQIDGHERVKQLQAPVFLLAGWFDPFLPSELNDYIHIRKLNNPSVVPNSHLVIGPWGHARTVTLPNSKHRTRAYRIESLAMTIPWLDHIFKNGSITIAPVKIFVMGINQWRDEQEWPLKRTQYSNLYLHKDGILTWQAPTHEENSNPFSYDPKNPVPSLGGAVLGPRSGMFAQNEIEKRTDVLVYSSDKLTKPLEVTGPIKVRLTISSDATCTDFTARLLDVYPDGLAYNLSEGIIRLQQVKQTLTPIEIDLWPTSNVFLKDHQIRLEISSSNFPRFDKNTNICGDLATMTESKIAKQNIYHSKSQASYIMLPIIPD